MPYSESSSLLSRCDYCHAVTAHGKQAVNMILVQMDAFASDHGGSHLSSDDQVKTT